MMVNIFLLQGETNEFLIKYDDNETARYQHTGVLLQLLNVAVLRTGYKTTIVANTESIQRSLAVALAECLLKFKELPSTLRGICEHVVSEIIW